VIAGVWKADGGDGPRANFLEQLDNGLATIRAFGKYLSVTSPRPHAGLDQDHATSILRGPVARAPLKIGEISCKKPRGRREKERGTGRSRSDRAHASASISSIRERSANSNCTRRSGSNNSFRGSSGAAVGFRSRLPARADHFIRKWKVIPIAIDEQGVQLCTPKLRLRSSRRSLRQHTSLVIPVSFDSGVAFEILAEAVLNPSPGVRNSVLRRGL